MGDYAALPTLTQVARTVFGNKRVHIFTFAFDGSSTWPAGALSLTPAMLGMSKVEAIFFNTELSGVVLSYDATNKLLKAWTANGTPGATALMIVATGSTPAASTVTITAIGYGLG